MKRLFFVAPLFLALSSFAQTPENGWSFKRTIGDQSATTRTRIVSDTATEGSRSQAFFFALPPNTSVEWQKNFGREFITPPALRCQFRPNQFGIREDESVFLNIYLVENNGSLFQINGALFGPWEWWFESDIGTTTYGTPPERFSGIVLRFYFNPQTTSGFAELLDLRLIYYRPNGGSAIDSVVVLDRFGDPEPVPVFSAPKTLNFGDVQVGSLKTDVLYIRNKGTAPLKISSVSSSNVAFATNLEKPTIQAGDSGRVVVTFHPTAAGTVNGNIIVVHNAPSSPDTITVSGTGSSTDVVVEEGRNLPTKLELRQNYPNPFNPSTTIEFSLPKPAFVNLAVYNASGQEVATLATCKLPEGVHRLTWDASRYPSGIYSYRLKANDFVAAKRMLLIK